MTTLLIIFMDLEAYAKVILFPLLLFPVVTEAFGALLSKAFQGGLLEGFLIGDK